MRKFVSVVMGVALCLSFVGCKDKEETCEHAWKYYTVKEANCTATGLIEKCCSICQEKEYITLEAKGHSLQDGVCSVCGAEDTEDSSSTTNDFSADTEDSSSTTNDFSADTEDSSSTTNDLSAFYTFTELYERALGLSYIITEDKFFDILDDSMFTNIYVNQLGRLKVTTDDKLVLDLGDIRTDYAPETTVLSTISAVEISRGFVYVVRNGVRNEIGSIAECGGVSTVNANIEGITINKENQLLVLYETGVVRAVGKIAANLIETSKTALVYMEDDDGYQVYGAYDRGSTELEIPFSHLGKSVTSIACYAFAGYNDLQSITIAEGIQELPLSAFYNCSALKEIYIPESVTQIGISCFSGCTALETVHFAGTQAQWASIEIREDNNFLTNARVIFGE